MDRCHDLSKVQRTWKIFHKPGQQITDIYTSKLEHCIFAKSVCQHSFHLNISDFIFDFSAAPQKMVDFYIGTRFNQSAIISGEPLSGKSTIWKLISKAINSLQSAELEAKSSTVFQKYSILVNYFNFNRKFPHIHVQHLFPDVYQNIDLFDSKPKGKHMPLPNRLALLDRLISQAEDTYTAAYELAQEDLSSNRQRCMLAI